MVGVLVGLKLEACWDFFSRRIEWRPKQIVLIHFLEYYRKCNFIGKKNKQTNKQKTHKSLFESYLPGFFSCLAV